MRHYGWDHRDEFGWFMSAALVALSLALTLLVIAHLLVDRYNGKVAAGDIVHPAARAAQAGRGVAVLGAAIGDVPGDASLAALRSELDARISGLPWSRALVRTNVRSAPLAIESFFFPFNSASEALGFCSRLSAAVPGCTTVIASSSELTTQTHETVGSAALARMGISPYAGETARTPQTRLVYVPLPAKIILAPPPPPRIVYLPSPAMPSPKPQIVYVPAPPPKIVYLPTPTPKTAAPALVASVTQPALRLQPGVGAGEVRYPETRVWLSAAYKPGDPRLTDVVGAGDVMMGSISTGLNPALKPGVDAAALVGADLAGIFRHADVAFANLEGPLYDGPNVTGKSCGNCFAFHGPTFYAGVLQSLGLDVVSLANNHSGDYGEDGRNSTMAALRASGIAYGGLDRDGARAAELVLASGRKVAVVAFAPNNGTLNINDLPAAAALIRDLKKTHTLVIVSFHGGAEGWSYVHVKAGTEMFVGENRGDVTAFAHTAIDAGADLVLGQGPHVPRAVEVYKGHLIAYSLGNFWTYSGVQTYAVSGMGPVLEAWLAPDGAIAGFTIHSTRQAGLGVPHLDPLDEAARYMLYLTRSDFPGTSALLAGHSAVASAAPGGGS